MNFSIIYCRYYVIALKAIRKNHDPSNSNWIPEPKQCNSAKDPPRLCPLDEEACKRLQQEFLGLDDSSPKSVLNVLLWKVIEAESILQFWVLNSIWFPKMFCNVVFSWSRLRCNFVASGLTEKNQIQGKPRNQISNQKLSSGETPKLRGKLSFWYLCVIYTNKKRGRTIYIKNIHLTAM